MCLKTQNRSTTLGVSYNTTSLVTAVWSRCYDSYLLLLLQCIHDLEWLILDKVDPHLDGGGIGGQVKQIVQQLRGCCRCPGGGGSGPAGHSGVCWCPGSILFPILLCLGRNKSKLSPLWLSSPSPSKKCWFLLQKLQKVVLYQAGTFYRGHVKNSVQCKKGAIKLKSVVVPYWS